MARYKVKLWDSWDREWYDRDYETDDLQAAIVERDARNRVLPEQSKEWGDHYAVIDTTTGAEVDSVETVGASIVKRFEAKGVVVTEELVAFIRAEVPEWDFEVRRVPMKKLAAIALFAESKTGVKNGS